MSNKANVNTDPNVNVDPGDIGSDAPPGLWGSAVSFDDAAKTLPKQAKKYPKTDNGFARFLMDGGASFDQVQQWRSSETGVEDAIAWASSDQFKYKPVGGRGGARLTEEDARLAGAFTREFGSAAPSGGKPGGGLTEAEMRTRGIRLRMKYGENRDNTATGVAAGGEAAAEVDATGKKRSKKAKPPERVAPRPISERIDEAKQDYIRRTGGREPPWYIGPTQYVKEYAPGVAAAVGAGLGGTLGVAATGALLRYAMGGGQKPQGRQRMSEEDRQRAKQARDQILSPGGAAPPAAAPANPAGAPADDNTTLLLDRMMRTREYA